VSGRKAIFEALIVNEEVTHSITRTGPASPTDPEAPRLSFSVLKAMRRAASGVISLEAAGKFCEAGSSRAGS
jgi:hypothetical protein